MSRKKEIASERMFWYIVIGIIILTISTFAVGQIQIYYSEDYTVYGWPFPMDFFMYGVFALILGLICKISNIERKGRLK